MHEDSRRHVLVAAIKLEFYVSSNSVIFRAGPPRSEIDPWQSLGIASSTRPNNSRHLEQSTDHQEKRKCKYYTRVCRHTYHIVLALYTLTMSGTSND